MNFRPHLKKLALVLGVMAVMCAQLFGVGRSFLCDCSGVPVATVNDHCHGPHGSHCVESEAPAHPMESHPDDGDALPHQEIVQDFQSAHAQAAELVLTAPVLQLVLVLDDLPRAKMEPVFAVENAVDRDGSPPPGVAVARTVVLLI